MDILYSRYSRKKNKKTTESVIFRLYSKDIARPIGWFDNVSDLIMSLVQRRNITDSVVFLVFFLEYREYKMSIFGICFILQIYQQAYYSLKLIIVYLSVQSFQQLCYFKYSGAKNRLHRFYYLFLCKALPFLFLHFHPTK